MIKVTNIKTHGWEAAIRGMRNPMNSWEKSDSLFITDDGDYYIIGDSGPKHFDNNPEPVYIGVDDFFLMFKLAKAGSDHAKYRRMIGVTMDILAPLYWWKEFDTYKVGTVANSCSTMHKIAEKEFTMGDFSDEHLLRDKDEDLWRDAGLIHTDAYGILSSNVLCDIIEALNCYRKLYLKTKNKKYWWQLIQLLPSSYNQLRTVSLNYEVLAHIYAARKDHKLDEWQELCEVIETLPYSRLITLKED